MLRIHLHARSEAKFSKFYYLLLTFLQSALQLLWTITQLCWVKIVTKQPPQKLLERHFLTLFFCINLISVFNHSLYFYLCTVLSISPEECFPMHTHLTNNFFSLEFPLCSFCSVITISQSLSISLPFPVPSPF